MCGGEVYFDGEVYSVFANCPECGEEISADLSALSSQVNRECTGCGMLVGLSIGVVTTPGEKPCMLSDQQRRALSIILSYDNGITPSQFAGKMWPDSQGHKTYYNVGRGVSRGAGMALAGGGYLGRLRNAGLARWRHTPTNAKIYYVTELARSLLGDCGGPVDF